MVEIILLNYLSGALDVPVFMEEPESPPASYVVLEKTGSTRSNQIETAVMAAQSYGRSLLEAARLNVNVKQAREEARELDSIGSVKLNSDYNFTDPETMRYRYQCVFNIICYEVN